MRPRARSRRLRQGVLGVAFLAMAMTAALVMRHLKVYGSAAAFLSSKAALAASPKAPGALDARRLKAVARVFKKGRPLGALSGSGLIFGLGAKEAKISEILPAVEIEGAGPSELKKCAEFFAAVSRAEISGPAIERLRYVSAQQGWQARLLDGTTVLWGTLDWTQEKLSRLSQVLHEARGEFVGAPTIDMRYFEDGRILFKTAKEPL